MSKTGTFPKTENAGGNLTATSQWYESYRAAVLETDWTKMLQRIQAAEFKVRESQRLLSEDRKGTPEERYAMASALNSLTVLRGDWLTWQKQERQKAESENARHWSAVPIYLVAGRAHRP